MQIFPGETVDVLDRQPFIKYIKFLFLFYV